MTVINTNTSALRAQNGTRMANTALQTAMARLSSGKRINSASDDAAGLAISNSMGSQITGMNQAIRNANDGISLAQTADGALDEVTNMAQRIRELAVQSASGTYSNSDRTNMQAEVTQLTAQIGSTLSQTKFNGVQLFDTTSNGSGVNTRIQTGADAGQFVNVNIGNLSSTLTLTTSTTGALGTAATADNPNTSHTVSMDDYIAGGAIAGTTIKASDIGKMVTQKTGDSFFVADATSTNRPTKTAGALSSVSVTTTDAANQTLASIDSLLATVNTVRAGIGASESQLNSAVNTLTNNVTNISDAKSRISDADFSAETTNLAKAQILSQASTAMLAQANQSQQGVLKLLQ